MTKEDLEKIINEIKLKHPNIDIEELNKHFEDTEFDLDEEQKSNIKNKSNFELDFATVGLYALALLFFASGIYYVYLTTYSPAFKNVGTYNYVIANIFKENIYNEKYDPQFDSNNKILKLNNVSFYEERKLSNYYLENKNKYDYRSTCEEGVCNIEIKKNN